MVRSLLVMMIFEYYVPMSYQKQQYDSFDIIENSSSMVWF